MKVKSIKKFKAGKQPSQQKSYAFKAPASGALGNVKQGGRADGTRKKGAVPSDSERDAANDTGDGDNGGDGDAGDNSSDEREALEEGLEIERLTQRIRDETPETGILPFFHHLSSCYALITAKSLMRALLL